MFQLSVNLHIEHERIIPINPSSLNGLYSAINNTDTSTSKGKEFLLINDQEINIIIFSCETNLIFLSESHTIFVDETFEYCPKYFTQLFTIHGLKNNFYVPLVFCVLKNKNSETYTKVFKYIQTKCYEKNLTFEFLTQKNVTVDFS